MLFLCNTVRFAIHLQYFAIHLSNEDDELFLWNSSQRKGFKPYSQPELFSPPQVSNMQQAEFEPSQNLSSAFVE